MSNSKISLVSGVIIPILTIALTIALFFVLHGDGDKSTLFYFNLCYSVVLEAIFFGYLGFVRSGSKKLTGAFYSIIGVYSIYYIITGFVCMLIYSLVLQNFIPLKYYISAIAVISLLWIILGSILLETDSAHKKDSDQLMERGHTLHYYNQKMLELEKRYITLSKDLNIPASTKNYNCELSRLSVKIKSLLPNVFNNDMTQEKLTSILDKCSELLDTIEDDNNPDKQKIADNIKRFTDRSIDQIELLKNLTRK